MGRLRQSTEKIQELLDKVENGEVGGKVTPDWNASERESGFIKSRTHYVSGTRSIPFENWNKSIDENGDAIYSFFVGYDESYGCIIRDGNYAAGEENYIFFETEWVSLSPAILADIRLNLDIESGDTLLEIKFYKDGDSEDYLKTFINNTLFATGYSDFTARIAENFIPNTIARQESVDELREETTALWENLDHGTFPNLVAGDLAGRGESVPAEFGFRASGGKSIKDGRAYIKRIKGNSVVWNQWVDTIATQDCDLSETDNRLTLTPQGGFPGVTNAISMNIVENHVYICISHRIGGGFLNVNCGGQDVATNVPFRAEQGHYGFVVYSYSETQPFTITRPILIDLTKMFGEGYEPTTIEEFNARKPIVADEYAYNEGEVIHCNTERIKSVGDNAWDEEWEVGGFTAEGVPVGAANRIRSRNYIEVLANEEYYANEYLTIFFYDDEMKFLSYMDMNSSTFTTPSGCRYIKFYLYGTEDYKHDTIISLYHSGWKAQKDDQYQPYWQDTLPLPIISKYFPDGMKKAGSAHDEIRFNKASGKWEKVVRIGSVDMGSLDWEVASNNRMIATSLENVIVRKDAANDTLLCAKYTNAYPSEVYLNTSDRIICSTNVGHIFVYDSAYTDAASFKASLQGVMLYYELAEPIVPELDDADQNFRDYYNVADFGTEMSQSNVSSAPFSADIIYQFNAVDMIREHEAEITELQKVIATMQAQLASLTSNNA